MGNDGIEIVPLRESHIPKIKTIMAEAFLEDPGVVATIGKSPEKRLPLLNAYFGAQARAALSHGLCKCALLDGAVTGLMLITGPGRETTVSALDLARLALHALFQGNLRGLRRGIKSALEDEKHRPKGPNYYLEVLAVDPKFQGRGVGGAMLSQLTDFADVEGLPTYLSATNPKTVPLYRKYGFQIISETNEVDIPNYHMTRKPGTDS